MRNRRRRKTRRRKTRRMKMRRRRMRTTTREESGGWNSRGRLEGEGERKPMKGGGLSFLGKRI